MFVTNLEKCLKLFDKVYVSSDSHAILADAARLGAEPILRGVELCGDTPNIPVYRHALEQMEQCDGIVAVQANSPTISPVTIERVKKMMEMGFDEVMTCHEDRSIYGSVWALSKKKLLSYGDPYKPKPEAVVVDSSTDIHTLEDYIEALVS
jgi:CMP-N-acetylneuraminic acid synthetase